MNQQGCAVTGRRYPAALQGIAATFHMSAIQQPGGAGSPQAEDTPRAYLVETFYGSVSHGRRYSAMSIIV